MAGACPKRACEQLEEARKKAAAARSVGVAAKASRSCPGGEELEKFWESDPESGDGRGGKDAGGGIWGTRCYRKRRRGDDDWAYLSYKAKVDRAITEAIQVLRYEHEGKWVVYECFMEAMAWGLGVETSVLNVSEASAECLHSRSKRRREPRFEQHKGRIRATEK